MPARPLARLAAAMALALGSVCGWVPSATAVPAGETTPGQDHAVQCLGDVTGTLRATPPRPEGGGIREPVTLSWTSSVPSGCAGVRFTLTNLTIGPMNLAVGPAGTMTVRPTADSAYSLRASMSTATRTLASAGVRVILPKDPSRPDRNLVRIDANDLVPLFVQALRTPNTTVDVANQMQLDLTARSDIQLARGVVLRGGRGGLEVGPRLFTTARPAVFFNVAGDFVRITGVRIEGPDMGVGDRHGNRGIQVDSKGSIEIDHNEIYGFSLAGISVWDGGNVMPPSESPSAVRIHDNYIHHNQAGGGDGYGVAVGYGGYPLIAHNVFDWNRHAIEGDGREGTGYAAIGNLVLEHGGYHRSPAPQIWFYTHQFDMHARNDCGVADIWSDSLANCGPAGHSMYIRHNTFFYANDEAIRLRGTPEKGMYVGQNVFANHLRFEDAVAYNETGLVEEPGNVCGYNGGLHLGSCDFDGDGIDDDFLATGATWWFSSGGEMPWTYVNTQTTHLSDLTLGYVDGDAFCDVIVGGVLFPEGQTLTAITPMPRPGLLRR